MASLPPSVYISDQDGSIYGNKAYVNQLTVIGNTMQSGVGSTPVLMTPSLAAANTYVYSTVANGVVSFLPTFNVLQDATGRARIASDLNIIGNVTATNYLNYPQYTLPSNLAVTSLAANVVQAGNLVSNTGSFANLTCNVASVGNLTVQSLSGYTPPTQNLTGNTLNYTTANVGQVAAVAGNIQSLSSNNVTVTGVANLNQVVAQSSNVQNIQSNNVTVAGTANLAQVQANNVTVTGLANVANLRYGTAVGNALNVQSVFATSIAAATGNALSITGNSCTFAFGNVGNLVGAYANIATLFVSNLLGYQPPVQNLYSISGNVANYQNVVANNVSVQNVLQAPASNVAQLLGAQQFLNYPVTLQSNVGAFTQFCTVSDPQTAGTYNVKVALVQSRGYNAVLKTYDLPFTYSTLPTTWQRCLPQYNTGIANGNDFALDAVSAGSSSVSLRVVRTAVGTMINPGITAYVSVISDTGYPITVTQNTTTGLNANNAGIYAQAPLGVNQGSICVLTENPQYPFDVNTSMRIGGALTANSIICSNIQGLPAQANLTNITGNSLTYAFGNVANLTSAYANVTTLYVSNLLGYQPPAANYSNLTGASLNYLTANVGNLTSTTEQTGNLTAANCRVTQLLTAPNVQATLANVTSLGAGSVNVATLFNAGAFSGTAYSFNLATPVGSYTQICNSNDPQTTSTYMIRVVLVQARTSNALLKSYSIPVTASYFGGSFLRCVPEFSLGSNNGNDFALDVYQYAPSGAVYLRAVRTASGTSTATGMTAYVTFTSDAGYPITFGYDGSTGNAATVGGLYNGCTLGCTAGNVGILTTTPAYPLDVGGTARLPTLLSSNVATSAVNIPGTGPINFAYDNTTKDPNAGVIGYQRFSGSCLDIIGAGTGPPNRAVRVWETLGVGMNPSYPLDISGTGRIPTLLTSNAQVTQANVVSLGATTLYCSNIVGYSPAQGVANTNNISGATANYTLITAGNVAASNVSVSGNLVVQGAGVNVSGAIPICLGYDSAGKDAAAGQLAYGKYSAGACLDIVGAGTAVGKRTVQVFDNLQVAGNVVPSGTVNYSTANPGDMVSKAYGAPGDRYGVGQYQNGTTRLFTSSAFGPATLNLSLASTDGGSGTSTQWTDIVTVSQSSVIISRPVNIPTTSNVNISGGGPVCFGYDVSGKELNAGKVCYGTFSGSCLDVVGAGTAAPSRSVRVYDQLGVGLNPAYPLDVSGNVRISNHAYVQGNAYITGPIVQNLGADPGEFIYSRFSGGIGDRYGIGQWPGGKTRVFSSATYTPGFAALSIASTDTLGPSGSNFQDIVVASNSAVTINRPLTVSASMMTQQSTAPGFFMGPSTAAGQAGYMVFNNSGAPSGASVLGFGVTGMPLGTGLSVNANGNVGIGQNSPAYLCDVGGSARVAGTLNLGSVVAMPANNIGDWMNTNYTPNLGNPSDRYGIGQYNNGAMRLFGSSYYNAATVNISLASADSTGGGGTFNDLLTASNTAIVMRRPVTVNAVANTTHSLQGQGYQNLFLGNTQSSGGCGFLTFNNPTSPGYTNSLGIGVYGAPGGITCSPNGSIGISQSQPSASTSLDIYGPVRAQMSFFSQTFWNAGGTYTISSSNYSLVNTTSIFTALYTGNNQSTDVSANSLWASGATFFTIPVNGIYHLSLDGTLNATNTVATYWAFSKIGGMSQSPNYFAGQNTCTNNLYISSACTLALTAGDQPYAAFASGSVGSFAAKNLSVRITLLQRL